MENLLLRTETPSDFGIVDNLTREAFWNRFVPGCVEHYLIHLMRNSESFIRELDFVAELDGKIVGNIVYTRAQIVRDNGDSKEVISFGPVSVLPEFQGKGIGSRLIEHTRDLAKRMGYRGILIYGDPEYYRRFGFVQAEEYGIGTADNMYAVPLQALELFTGGLSNCSGRFFEDSIFEVDEKAAEEFDKNFPHKEKLSGLPTQERFLQLISMRKPRE